MLQKKLTAALTQTDWIIFSVIFGLPLYFLRFKIGSLPTNVLEILIYVLFLVWLFNQSRPQVLSRGKIWLAVGILFLGVSLATVFSQNLRLSAGIWKGWFVDPLFVFVILINLNQGQKYFKLATIAIVLSGLGVSLIALFYKLFGHLTYDARLKAFYLSPNHLAMFLAIAIIFSFYGYYFFRKKIAYFGLVLIDGVMISVLFLTYSYGAWLALGCSALFFFLLSLSKKNSLKIIASALLLIIILFIFNQWPTQKFQGFFYDSRSSWQSRIMVWQSAWAIIKDHPFLGIGPGMFQDYYLAYQPRFEPYLEWAMPQPHNLFLAFWLQTGLLGLAGFVWLISLFFVQLIRARKNYWPEAIVLLCVMVYILLHGLIDTTYWKNDLAVLFWLVIALGCKDDRLCG